LFHASRNAGDAAEMIVQRKGERLGFAADGSDARLTRSRMRQEAAGDAFGFASAAEQAIGAEVIVESGPVDAGAGAASFPVAQLLGGGLQ
jgi:hypothetical protein